MDRIRTDIGLRRSAAAVGLCLSATYFWVRGLARGLGPTGGYDFLNYFHIGLRTFAHGGNPYLLRDLSASGIGWHFNFAMAYPPAFFALAPIGLLSPRTAALLWLLLGCMAFAAILWSSKEQFTTPWTAEQGIFFLICALCLAPVHTDLQLGNMGTLCSAFLAGLFFCLQRNLTISAGILLGVLMIKPTFGCPAALIVLALGNIRSFLAGVGVCAAISMPIFARLGPQEALSGPLRNMALQVRPGMTNDESLLNPNHYQMIGLRSWLFGFAGPRWADLLTTMGVGLMLYCLFRFRKKATGSGAGFYWTLASVFVLLAFYHRFYDAGLLLVPIAATFDLYRRNNRFWWPCAAALVPFAAPGTMWLHVKLGDAADRYTLLEALLIRHETLALLLLAAVSIVGLYQASPSVRTAQPVDLDLDRSTVG